MDNMHSDEIEKWDLLAAARFIKNGDISPVEVTRRLLDRIEQLNPKLNAFITVLHDEALAAAKTAEQEIASGNWKGPLHGVPVGLKDLIYTRNYKTTMGSKHYKDYAPDYDAAAVEKLRRAGAVIIGKLNTHQFAYGPTGDRSYFGPVRNPYDLSKMTGGSSSGSGAAVAAGLCFAALGTDTGGSIRIPAACCGIVGMKPTYGRVSKYGVYPLSWTLDHVGPMTRTVADNAALLQIIAGFDARDPYSIEVAGEDFGRFLGREIKGGVIGVPTSFFFENLQPEVAFALQKAMDVFARLGAEFREVDLPDMQEISRAQQITIQSEAYAVHQAALQNSPDLYETEVRERLAAGGAVKAHDYALAQHFKHSAKKELFSSLEHVDLLLAPTLPIVPPDIDQREVIINGNSEPVRGALLGFTGPANFTGFPSISIPCGLSQFGLPIGMQLIGKPLDEANLYRFAYAFEQAAPMPALQLDSQII